MLTRPSTEKKLNLRVREVERAPAQRKGQRHQQPADRAEILLAAEFHQDDGRNDDIDQEFDQRIGFLAWRHGLRS
jgi:hypothetical protein